MENVGYCCYTTKWHQSKYDPSLFAALVYLLQSPFSGGAYIFIFLVQVCGDPKLDISDAVFSIKLSHCKGMVDVALKHLAHCDVCLSIGTSNTWNKLFMPNEIIQIELLCITGNKVNVFQDPLHYPGFFCDLSPFLLV